MKGDMRYSYPLWQMGFIVLLIALTTIIGFTADYAKSTDSFIFQFTLEGDSFWYMAAWLAVLVFYMILFKWKLHQHNKRNPDHQMKFTSFKPQEYMADDELFEEVTRRATQKAYSYFTVALPLLATMYLILPIGKFGMLNALLLLAIGQYFVYYRTIRRYMAEDAV
ncbi:hypothetical protein SLU01_29250 [Sporosarcina luteola]|uniref:DUF3169 domain-containing protein n=1 Tax=Sporosarcina luteola TaxID=582850 RepID=A0A511ZB35_9BACL|nr:hypothetical protein [Sporosarcina luteola]GEN84613.1 hypothetical protein SLU01_29250 [Sporosarcina luteola]